MRYLALPHDWTITIARGVRDTKYLWLCKLHTWRCSHPRSMTDFITVPVYDRQERLL